MKPQTAILKLRTRLNKISSSDYDNIEDWAAVEAIHKSALEITRNIIHGNTKMQDGVEETSFRITDLQHLLVSTKLKGNNIYSQYYEGKLPKDFLWYSTVEPIVSKGDCTNKKIISNLREQANANVLLEDYNSRPSFEWRETFHTLLDNKIRIYTANEFDINEVILYYYRKPIKMDIYGYTHEDGTVSQNVDLEFKDDLAEIIIDNAASIIAGDIESINQNQINSQRTQINI